MLEAHLSKAMEQLQKGSKIGRRETPVISFWPMRPKWEWRPDVWELIGWDGDVWVRGGTPMAPATLQLVYFKVPQTRQVCQLAYVLEEEAPDTEIKYKIREEISQRQMKEAMVQKHGKPAASAS